MPKLERFDRAAAKTLGLQVPARLKALADEMGLEVAYTGGTFDDGQFTCRVRFTLREVGGVPADEAAFKRDCGVLGLKPEHFGATFDMPSGKARIVGLQAGRKRPVVVEILAKPGKRYVVEDAFVRKALGCPRPWEAR